MLVFVEGWNIRELWKKGEGKRLNSAISGHNCKPVLVPNRGGTGTTYAVANWYQYHPKWYQYHPPKPVRYRYQIEWYRYH